MLNLRWQWRRIKLSSFSTILHEEYICSNLNCWSIFTANIYLHSCIIKYIDILHIHFFFLITKICIYINTMGLCLCVCICSTHTHTHTHTHTLNAVSCVCFPFSQAVSLHFHLGFYILKCFSIPAIIGHYFQWYVLYIYCYLLTKLHKTLCNLSILFLLISLHV